MKFLADENVESEVVAALERASHQVVQVGAVARGAQDADVLRMASAGRVLLTWDLDFGELIYRSGLPAEGVLLIRLHGLSPAAVAAAVVRAVRDKGEGLIGKFHVLRPRGLSEGGPIS